jgi:hypothetical protein
MFNLKIILTPRVLLDEVHFEHSLFLLSPTSMDLRWITESDARLEGEI